MQQSRTSRGVLLSLLITAVAGCFSGNTLDAKPPPQPREEPSGKVNYDSGYFATPITIPDDPRQTGITNINLQCPQLTGQGADATISFRNSKAKFNDFGDAEVVQERQTRNFDVTLTPISVADATREGRRVFNVVFPDGRWTNRIYFVWSPGLITTSRLLIRSGEGKLPDIVITPDRPVREDEINLAYLLPSTQLIPRRGRPASEDVLKEISLQSYHFESRDVSRTEGASQGYLRIGGKLQGQLMMTHDLNRTRFTPFGDLGSSTAVGHLPRAFHATQTSTDDPAGLGRRLFRLEYQSRNEPGDGEVDHWRPPFDYSLVLAPKIDGPHRLIIRQQGQIRHVLPLYDAPWRRYQQKRILLAQTSQQEQEAIAELRRLVGNRLNFEVQEDQVTSISFLQLEHGNGALVHLEQFPHLKGLSFRACRDLTPDELRPLNTLTQLESLSFSSTPVSDAVLAHLAPAKKLRSLRIDNNTRLPGEKREDVPHISDSGLGSLAHLVNLTNLSLRSPGITDAGLEHFYTLKALKRLYLSGTAVTLAGLDALSKQLPDTEIDAAPLMASDGRETYSFKIHRRKQQVWINGRADDSVLKQCANCEGITSLSFSGLHAVTDEGFGHIAKMDDLEALEFQHAKLLTDDGLRQIEHQKHLKSLNLWYCSSITDNGLEHLRGLTQLKSLNVGGTMVTQAGIDRLQKALPNCKIEK